jgi:predicted phage terminase large subunit-like protein
VTSEISPAAVGGPIAGRGGDLLILDDPLKGWAEAISRNVRNKQIEWFNSTFLTRAEPGASVVVIMTRWHEYDLAGYLRRYQSGKWTTLDIPAIAEEEDPLGRSPGMALCEERFGPGALREIRESIGTRAWSALYQQRPVSDEGNILKREWWKHYEKAPAELDEVIQSWDLSYKGSGSCDYVVGQVWGRKGATKYLLDQVRGKMDFPETLEAVKALTARYPHAHRKLIEEKANGSAVIAALKETIPGLVVVRPEGGKEARLNAVAAQIEAGNVFLPAASIAPWIEEFLAECSDFPNGRHDDQVDAMAYALRNFREGKTDARTQCAGGPDLSDLDSSGKIAAGTDRQRDPRSIERA